MTNEIRELVVNAQTGDRDAFTELVRRFQDMAVGYATSLVGDVHHAEDIAQEAFVAAWTELPRLREPEAFPGWFRRLVFMRSTRVTRKLRRDDADDEISQDLTATDTDGNIEVYQALNTLPDEERIATMLYYIGNHSHERIADFLGLTTTTVNNRLRSARRRLKEEILEMAKETLEQDTPSRNDAFVARVNELTQPNYMATEHYVYGVEPLNGHDAWALFCAAAAGDLVRVKALLERDPRLVNAQHWYQFPIHMAVRGGHADVVQLLLENGADPGQSRYLFDSWDKMLAAADARGHRAVKKLLETAMQERFAYDPAFDVLRDAIKERNVSDVEKILNESPELATAADELGNTGIHWAVITRQVELIDQFLSLGADLDARRADGQTPLLVSINGDYWYRASYLPQEVIQNTWMITGFLLGKGAHYDFHTACALADVVHIEHALKENPQLANRLNASNQSALYYAARFGHTHVCKMLLDAGADPNQPEDLAPLGRALYSACNRNHLSTVELLLAAGANPNGEEDSGGTCISVVESLHPDDCGPILEALRKAGGETPAWNMSAEEFKAKLREGTATIDMLSYYLLAQEDAEIFDLIIEFYGDRISALAATDVWGGDIAPPEQMQKLIDHGLDPNRPNWIGRTFLHTCACKGAIDAAKVLLANGAEIDPVDLESGGTPLAEAVRHGQTDMVEFLLKQGADPDAPEESPWATPRNTATDKGDEAILALFPE